MSNERSTSKRQHEEVESDCEEEVKRAKVELEEEPEEDDEKVPILDAIKTIDKIQYELNMHNVFMDSPESSDHDDTPPESEDDEGEGALSQAHALGYAACIRETFKFLESCGIPENDPIYKQLKSRFVGISN
jgi:hypothetical protein